MIAAGHWPIGVCTWSLHNDYSKLEQLRKDTGLEHVHLDLNPVLDGKGSGSPDWFRNNGWNIAATMVGFPQEDYTSLESIKRTGGIVPDECWDINRKRVQDAIDMTSASGVKYLEFHFGFLGESFTAKENPLIERAAALAEAAQKKGVVLLMETGQETPLELGGFLKAVSSPALAVNFDPGNLILYGKGQPVKALEVLSPWIRNIHAKDALSSDATGEWGKEMVWGRGDVKTTEFLDTLSQTPYSGALCIEREAGSSSSRYEDIKEAVRELSGWRR